MAEGGCGGNSAMPERIELSPRHLPEYLEGRTPKKNVLSFLEEIGRAQIRKARNIFLWCCRAKRGSGGASSFVGVLRKVSSDFFKQTPRVEKRVTFGGLFSCVDIGRNSTNTTELTNWFLTWLPQLHEFLKKLNPPP